MASVNKVILIGNIGRDPELRVLEGNISRVNFTLATNETYKDKHGNRIDHTEWHNIVMWRSLAESAHRLLKKGMQVYVEGKIQTRQWIDKEGNKRTSYDIVGETFSILGKREHAHKAENKPHSQNQENLTQTTDEFSAMGAFTPENGTGSSENLPF
ncbi:MAG: single-stranded DNA-binding protein [Bacteroidia bacterium]|nr:single-stranded DNA-binding protein [Bacteroidia bacterium]